MISSPQQVLDYLIGEYASRFANSKLLLILGHTKCDTNPTACRMLFAM